MSKAWDTRLRRRDYKGAGLDRPRPQQGMPVRAAGGACEGGRHRDNVCALLRQRPEQVRKTQIVAHCHADRSPRQTGGHGPVSGRVGPRLPVGFRFRQYHVEHMNLVVLGNDVSCRRNQERPVCSFLIAHAYRQRPYQKPAVEFLSQRAKSPERIIGSLVPDTGKQRLAVKFHQRRHFRCGDQIRTTVGSVADQRFGIRDVFFNVPACANLDTSDRQHRNRFQSHRSV